MATKLHPLKASLAVLLLGLATTVFAVPESSTPASDFPKEKGIGLLPFVPLGEETPQWLAKGIETYLRHNLRDLRGTRVPLEEEMISALQLTGISLSEQIETEKLDRLGKKLSVDWLVLGAVQLKGNKIQVKIKTIPLRRTKNGKELEQKGTLENLNLMLQETTVLMAEACRVAITPEDRSWIVAPGDFKYTDFKEIEAARLFSKKEDDGNALKNCEEILKKHPRLTDAVLAAAEACANVKQDDRTEKFLKEGINKNPNSVALSLKLSELYLRQGKVDEAKRRIDSILVQHPSEPHALLLLGRAYYQKGLRELALNTLEKGIAGSAQKEEFYLTLSQIQKEKGNLSLALSLCESALSENPKNAEGLKKKGILLGLTGDYDGAVASYGKSISTASALSPKPVSPAVSHAQQAATLREYKEAVKKDPSDAAAHNAMGAALAQEGKWVEAIESYRAAVRINPQFAPSYFNLAVIYEKQGNKEQAINCYRKALELNPRHRESSLNLAEIYESAGERSAALKILENVLSFYPADEALAAMLADQYARNGKWKKVTEIFESVQKVSGVPGQASFMIAQAYERQGKKKKAKAFYERSFKENPKLIAKKQ